CRLLNLILCEVFFDSSPARSCRSNHLQSRRSRFEIRRFGDGPLGCIWPHAPTGAFARRYTGVHLCENLKLIILVRVGRLASGVMANGSRGSTRQQTASGSGTTRSAAVASSVPVTPRPPDAARCRHGQ